MNNVVEVRPFTRDEILNRFGGMNFNKQRWNISNKDIRMNTVFMTRNYSKFKKLEGNREVGDRNLDGIVQAHEAIGQIPIPIVVNENYEICEGQHRFDCWYNERLPIYYIIIPDIGIKECIVLNSVGKNWNNEDRINCYSKSKELYIEDFNRLAKLRKRFPDISQKVLSVAVNKTNAFASRDMKNGTLTVSEEQYASAVEILTMIDDFLDTVKKSGVDLRGYGSLIYVCQVLAYCYHFGDIDLDRMMEKFIKDFSTYGSWNSIDSCFDRMEKIYNRGLKEDKRIKIVEKYLELKSKKKSMGRTDITNKKENRHFTDNARGVTHIIDHRKNIHNYEKPIQ